MKPVNEKMTFSLSAFYFLNHIRGEIGMSSEILGTDPTGCSPKMKLVSDFDFQASDLAEFPAGLAAVAAALAGGS